MHQKVLLVDRMTSMIGTHNFDNRSFRLNFEVGALVYDEAFTAEVEAMLRRDLESCAPLDPRGFEDRSFLWRLGVQTARLLAPIL
jgi:cardiolipin synthase